MIQLTKIVSVVVVGLLAVAPVLAGLPCAASVHPACAAEGPMAMSGMGADCPMAGQMAAGGCPQDCCASAIAQAVTLVAAPERLRLVAAASPPVVAAEVAVHGRAPTVFAETEARASSPPPYLLNRVFRI